MRRQYTAIDLVIAARGCSFDSAVDWLEPFLDPEPRAAITRSMAVYCRRI